MGSSASLPKRKRHPCEAANDRAHPLRRLFGGKSTTTLTAIATASARGSGATVEAYNVRHHRRRHPRPWARVPTVHSYASSTECPALARRPRPLQSSRPATSPCHPARGHRRHQRRWHLSARWTGSPSSRSQTCQRPPSRMLYDCKQHQRHIGALHLPRRA